MNITVGVTLRVFASPMTLLSVLVVGLEGMFAFH